eukprot:Awhi_evm1s7379
MKVAKKIKVEIYEVRNFKATHKVFVTMSIEHNKFKTNTTKDNKWGEVCELAVPSHKAALHSFLKLKIKEKGNFGDTDVAHIDIPLNALSQRKESAKWAKLDSEHTSFSGELLYAAYVVENDEITQEEADKLGGESEHKKGLGFMPSLPLPGAHSFPTRKSFRGSKPNLEKSASQQSLKNSPKQKGNAEAANDIVEFSPDSVEKKASISESKSAEKKTSFSKSENVEKKTSFSESNSTEKKTSTESKNNDHNNNNNIDDLPRKKSLSSLTSFSRKSLKKDSLTESSTPPNSGHSRKKSGGAKKGMIGTFSGAVGDSFIGTIGGAVGDSLVGSVEAVGKVSKVTQIFEVDDMGIEKTTHDDTLVETSTTSVSSAIEYCKSRSPELLHESVIQERLEMQALLSVGRFDSINSCIDQEDDLSSVEDLATDDSYIEDKSITSVEDLEVNQKQHDIQQHPQQHTEEERPLILTSPESLITQNLNNTLTEEELLLLKKRLSEATLLQEEEEVANREIREYQKRNRAQTAPQMSGFFSLIF